MKLVISIFGRFIQGVSSGEASNTPTAQWCSIEPVLQLGAGGRVNSLVAVWIYPKLTPHRRLHMSFTLRAAANLTHLTLNALYLA